MVSLSRDRAALVLSFVLPIVFFSIFAVIFGGRRNVAASIDVMVVDQDRNVTSQRLIEGLTSEGSLVVATRPNPKKGETQPEYTALTAEAAVKAGASPEVMAGVGTKYVDRFAGGLTPEQHKRIDDSLDRLRRYQSQPNASRQSGSGALVSVKSRDVVGENKENPMVSFYAAPSA
jgi:ABC-2 type transport system permease protein